VVGDGGSNAVGGQRGRRGRRPATSKQSRSAATRAWNTARGQEAGKRAADELLSLGSPPHHSDVGAGACCAIGTVSSRALAERARGRRAASGRRHPDTNSKNLPVRGASPPASGYTPPVTATSWKAGRFTGTDFPLQPDGTLRCPAGSTLLPHEQRREADGSLRVVYGASTHACRPCPVREQCQWSGSATAKPRQVSMLLHPLSVGSAPLLWRDWSRRHQRRACVRLHPQHLEILIAPSLSRAFVSSPPTFLLALTCSFSLSG
jgi:hypothetical protein